MLRRLLLMLILLVPYAVGDHIGMVVEEEGKVISYYDEYYVVQVTGNVSIRNGYNNTMYNIVIPYNIDTLNIFELTDSEYIKPGQFEFQIFDPHETKTFNYEIRGITATDPMKDNLSVLRSAIDWEKASLHSLLITKVKKSEVEQNDINTSGVVSVRNRRLITVSLENPSEAQYNVTAVHVLKTPDQDPNDVIEEWHYPENGAPYMMIAGREIWERDVIDYNVSPDDVYWLSVDMETEFKLLLNGSYHSIYRFDQDDLLDPVNMTLDELEQLGNVSDFLEYMMYVKKSYSSTWMRPGEQYEVDIRVNNFAPINRNITVTDYIPYGFALINYSDGTMVENDTIVWKRNINPDSSLQIKYILEYTDDDSLGIDFFEPCMVNYDNYTLYSQRIPFIRKSIPKKKVFLQKKITASLNDEYVVELYVKNVGESKLQNVLVKEFLQAGDTFRELSKLPYDSAARLWKIDELKVDEAWTVSYVTNDNDALTAFPEIIGIDDNTMLKTLLFEPVVKNQWFNTTIRMMEYIGLTVLILGIVLFVPVNRWRRRMKERELRNLGKRVHKLKVETTPGFKDSINYLKKESRKGLDVPDEERFHMDVKGARPRGSTRGEAHKNLDDLHKLKENTGHKSDKK